MKLPPPKVLIPVGAVSVIGGVIYYRRKQQLAAAEEASAAEAEISMGLASPWSPYESTYMPGPTSGIGAGGAVSTAQDWGPDQIAQLIAALTGGGLPNNPVPNPAPGRPTRIELGDITKVRPGDIKIYPSLPTKTEGGVRTPPIVPRPTEPRSFPTNFPLPTKVQLPDNWTVTRPDPNVPLLMSNGYRSR